jgi:adenine phosphoribosyltransferase
MTYNHTQLDQYIRTVPDFPIPGIQFKDISSLLENPFGFSLALNALEYQASQFLCNCVVGIESRGFVFGAPLANRMTVPFIMARKPGKLPNSTVCKSYDLEYGSAELHIQEVSPIHGNVLIIDDLIATGGTALACADLINEKWNIPNQDIMILSVIDLPVLGGSSKIKDSGYQCVSLLEYDDE